MISEHESTLQALPDSPLMKLYVGCLSIYGVVYQRYRLSIQGLFRRVGLRSPQGPFTPCATMTERRQRFCAGLSGDAKPWILRVQVQGLSYIRGAARALARMTRPFGSAGRYVRERARPAPKYGVPCLRHYWEICQDALPACISLKTDDLAA